MSEYLKGNYPLAKKPDASGDKEKTLEQQFEESALQKLGGSIAFVKKSAKFVWEGSKRDESGRKPR